MDTLFPLDTPAPLPEDVATTPLYDAPFMLRRGVNVVIEGLPHDLTRGEAERLVRFVRLLGRASVARDGAQDVEGPAAAAAADRAFVAELLAELPGPARVEVLAATLDALGPEDLARFCENRERKIATAGDRAVEALQQQADAAIEPRAPEGRIPAAVTTEPCPLTDAQWALLSQSLDTPTLCRDRHTHRTANTLADEKHLGTVTEDTRGPRFTINDAGRARHAQGRGKGGFR